MKAVAVKLRKKNGVHLRDIDKPKLNEIKNGRGILVKVLRVGVDGTDKKIVSAGYGDAPDKDEFLIIGHECLGQVESVGKNVVELKPGDYVVPTVRRPGTSLYDHIGMSDMTTDDTYFERGINLLHGFLTEYFIDEPEHLVQIPSGLKHTGVLLEPVGIVVKAITQAYEIQRRLRVWKPKRAAVLGNGSIGLLATLLLRLRGIHVVTTGIQEPPYLNSDLIEEIDAKYINAKKETLKQISKKHGPFDLIIEATGQSPLVFEAMEILAKNGVLALLSITGGNRTVEIPSDKINQSFVLGNKVAFGSVNANREHFEMAIKEMTHAEFQYPGWLQKLLTHPVKGLSNYNKLFKTLDEGENVIKVYCEVTA